MSDVSLTHFAISSPIHLTSYEPIFFTPEFMEISEAFFLRLKINVVNFSSFDTPSPTDISHLRPFLMLLLRKVINLIIKSNNLKLNLFLLT